MQKALMVASFGTTLGDTCEKNIAAVENDLAVAFPQHLVCRAFTSGMIRKVLQKRGVPVHGVPQALESLAAKGISNVTVLPTHLLPGVEYEKLLCDVRQNKACFAKVDVAQPLLSSREDMRRVLKILCDANTVNADEALVLMGHGTTHPCNVIYRQLAGEASALCMEHIFIGTVEATPSLDEIMTLVQRHGYKKVLLTPLMLVAGDHAVNDMASDEPESWKSRFAAEGFEVRCHVKGLGEYAAIRTIYCEHAAKAERI